MDKKLKICLSIILPITLILIITVSAVFSKGSYKPSITKMPYTVVDKVKAVLINGHSVELKEDELNSVIDLFFKEEKVYNNLKIKGVDATLTDNKLQLYIPVHYKGINLLLISEGTLSYESNKLYYKPIYFKVGKMKLPKNYVLEKLKSRLNKAITVENGSIAVDKSSIPVNIKTVAIKDSKIIIDVEKSSVSLQDKLKSMPKIISSIINALGIKSDSIAEKENKVGKENTETKTQPSNNTEKVIMDNKNSPERDAALNSVATGLYAAMGSVSTGGQRAVISQMISVIDSMKGNPSYNPYSASGSVRSAYSKLSAEEKQQLKSAVFSNIDMGAVNILSRMMGG